MDNQAANSRLNTTSGQSNTLIDSSMLSNYGADNSGLLLGLQSSMDSNYFQDLSKNQLAKFWQSSPMGNYLQTPNFMPPSVNNRNSVLGSSDMSLGQTNPLVPSLSTLQLQPQGITDMQNGGSISRANTNNASNKYPLRSSTKGSMNINAPSYIPNYADSQHYNTRGNNLVSQNSTDLQQFDLDKSPLSNTISAKNHYGNYTYAKSNGNVNFESNINSQLEERSSLGNYRLSNNNSAPNGRTDNDESSDDARKLKVEIMVKNQIIKSLTDQLNTANFVKSKNLESLGRKSSSSGTMKIPNNFYQLFKDLTRTLMEKTQELDETKQRLEAILVSITINNSSNNHFTANGNYDEQEIAHKIVNKLSLLQNENENLLKMISFSNKSSLMIELGLLKNENKLLKEKLGKLEQSK
ncbi:uncharacterized protein PRCAT00000803001 [Priceomyces carsonii]|uniref:uncharacterized protein n=1 Tax=Priceomyces carsonii TaxID=28549 RepID=UPI002EDBAEDF|nr:unnamed protein product [Priceomyces carsonii]